MKYTNNAIIKINVFIKVTQNKNSIPISSKYLNISINKKQNKRYRFILFSNDIIYSFCSGQVKL